MRYRIRPRSSWIRALYGGATGDAVTAVARIAPSEIRSNATAVPLAPPARPDTPSLYAAPALGMPHSSAALPVTRNQMPGLPFPSPAASATLPPPTPPGDLLQR